MSVTGFAVEHLQSFLKENFRLNASVTPLDSYIDQNFRVTAEDGRRYVLKISSRSVHTAELDLQNEAMIFLQKHCHGLEFPEVQRTVDGRHICQYFPENGSSAFDARLLSFLEGTFLHEIENPGSKLLQSFGAALGQMDRSLQAFRHPAAWRNINWDLEKVARLRADLSTLGSPAKQRLVDYFLMQYEQQVLPEINAFHRTVIHNDANDYNVLAKTDQQGNHFISGFIDFGDMIYSCAVFEVAIAATYMMFRSDDPIEVAAEILSAYHGKLPLKLPEIDALFYLIGARLCNSVIMAARERQQNPDNEYISVSEKDAWQLLEKLICENPLAARKRFRQACKISGGQYFRGADVAELLAKRQKIIGPNLSVAYRKPLHITGGAMQYLFAGNGRTYLDCVNNVSHVGHCHPAVVRAAQRQMALLNTNTRYLHDNLLDYADRLTAKLPEPLRVCYFVNSGSEANDLAIRLARAYSGAHDCLVIDNAYHGHTQTAIELSPYKFDHAGGAGPAEHIHKVPMPDIFRGPYVGNSIASSEAYAADFLAQLQSLQQQGRSIAAFIAEALPGCGGQVVFPDDYLKKVFDHARAAGIVCIADEVQIGFGRVGSHFWGFETQNALPDIVTMGKPIGNGHPLAAVVTTAEIAAAFDNGMEYFNTFGGNPVSCAVGMAVLDVIESEDLQANAFTTGNYLMERLGELQQRHPIIGDVRGRGLFIGAELIEDAKTLAPATRLAAEIVNRMRENDILISTDGPFNNVLKIKPPLQFNRANADTVFESLDNILEELI